MAGVVSGWLGKNPLEWIIGERFEHFRSAESGRKWKEVRFRKSSGYLTEVGRRGPKR